MMDKENKKEHSNNRTELKRKTDGALFFSATPSKHSREKEMLCDGERGMNDEKEKMDKMDKTRQMVPKNMGSHKERGLKPFREFFYLLPQPGRSFFDDFHRTTQVPRKAPRKIFPHQTDIESSTNATGLGETTDFSVRARKHDIDYIIPWQKKSSSFSFF